MQVGLCCFALRHFKTVPAFTAIKGLSLVSADTVSGTQPLWTEQLWTEQVGNDLMLYGNSGGDSAADFSIKLQGVAGLSASDLILA